jgi:hypothetical protein
MPKDRSTSSSNPMMEGPWCRSVRHQRDQLQTAVVEQRIGADDERIDALLREAHEGGIDLARGAGADHFDGPPDRREPAACASRVTTRQRNTAVQRADHILSARKCDLARRLALEI